MYAKISIKSCEKHYRYWTAQLSKPSPQKGRVKIVLPSVWAEKDWTISIHAKAMENPNSSSAPPVGAVQSTVPSGSRENPPPNREGTTLSQVSHPTPAPPLTSTAQISPKRRSRLQRSTRLQPEQPSSSGYSTWEALIRDSFGQIVWPIRITSWDLTTSQSQSSR